jgi:uncharacterized membrane protein YhaH (DUF805 family)
MSFAEAVTTCLTKYADFTGRARRSEYWWFYLFTLVISWVFFPISATLSYVASLALILPSLAAGARRLHDTNRSGWLLLVGLIPILGWILLIVWLATEGDAGPNQYGDSPKGAPAY